MCYKTQFFSEVKNLKKMYLFVLETNLDRPDYEY